MNLLGQRFEARGRRFFINAFGGLHLLLEGGVVRASDDSRQEISVRKHSIPFFRLFNRAAASLGRTNPDRNWADFGHSA